MGRGCKTRSSEKLTAILSRMKTEKSTPLFRGNSEISFLPDIQSEFMLFIQGKFDFLNSLDTSYKDD